MLLGRGLCVGLITRPTECGVSACDREASVIAWPWPTGGGGGAFAKWRKKYCQIIN